MINITFDPVTFSALIALFIYLSQKEDKFNLRLTNMETYLKLKFGYSEVKVNKHGN